MSLQVDTTHSGVQTASLVENWSVSVCVCVTEGGQCCLSHVYCSCTVCGGVNTTDCIIIAQTLHCFLLFSGATLQIAPAQSDFNRKLGDYSAINSQYCTVWVGAWREVGVHLRVVSIRKRHSFLSAFPLFVPSLSW